MRLKFSGITASLFRGFPGNFAVFAPPPPPMKGIGTKPQNGFENFWIFFPTLTPLRRLLSRRFVEISPPLSGGRR
jgi:hypothetical protein